MSEGSNGGRIGSAALAGFILAARRRAEGEAGPDGTPSGEPERPEREPSEPAETSIADELDAADRTPPPERPKPPPPPTERGEPNSRRVQDLFESTLAAPVEPLEADEPGGPLLEKRGERLRTRRSRRRTTTVAGAIAVVLLAAFVGWRLSPAGRGDGDGAAGGIAAGDQATTLVILTRAGDLSERAEALALFTTTKGDPPSMVFLPTMTMTEIPGTGPDALGKAYSVGRGPLQAATAENLMGVRIDETIALDDVTLAGWIDAAGGIRVDVTEKLQERDSEGRLVQAFPMGAQTMDGATAVTYLEFEGESDSELSRFPRMEDVWDGLFAAIAENPDLAGTIAGTIGDGVVSTARPAAFADLLAEMASVTADERIATVLPVTTVGPAGGGEAYRVDEKKLAALRRDLFGGASLREGESLRVEVRNGNGRLDGAVPASSSLIRNGFRVTITGNAPTFDYDTTLIVVYDDSAESIAVAERIKKLLGVGEIQIGRRSQTTVDVTVVVGRDFPRGGGS